MPLAPGVGAIDLGDNYYLINLPRILQTGSKVSTSYGVPYAHEFLAMYVKHVDTNLADATTSLTFNALKHLRENLMFSIGGFVSPTSDELFTFTNRISNITAYRFETTGTSTDYVYITMLIRAIGVRK